MLLYRTSPIAWTLEPSPGKYLQLPQSASQGITTREDLFEFLHATVPFCAPAETPKQPLAPLEAQEIWAAGVTYFRSRDARMAESQDSGGGDFYDRVYSAVRPELFMKGTPHRVVGPEANVRIRRDSKWNVPEPELTLLISPGGKITGYTIGNDMSSRDIEGENPLYLPQAKVYDGSSAIGPAILVTKEAPGKTTKIALKITRAGKVVFDDFTTLAELKRPLEELVEYLYRESSFPGGCMLMTGTGLVPGDAFTLLPADRVEISIDGIGTLANMVEQLA
ncbi:MAG: fumarylacetoacetate hydrolase family protein [Acidobacteriota bacterium]